MLLILMFACTSPPEIATPRVEDEDTGPPAPAQAEGRDYRDCSSQSECDDDSVCITHATANGDVGYCAPQCYDAPCPVIGDFDTHCYGLGGGDKPNCILVCDAAQQCPEGMVCVDFGPVYPAPVCLPD